MRHYITGTVVTLLLYYALFLYLGMLLAEYCSLPFFVAFIVPLFLFLLQYLLFPKVVDGICSPVDWQTSDTPYPEIPEVLEESREQGLVKPPAWGISPSPFPVVFTYGHHRRNCRIILSSGLCELLSPEERKALVAHELRHVYAGDFWAVMSTGLLPILMFLFSWNILLIGIGMRQLKSTRSLALFGLILWGVSRILYFMLYFACRARHYRSRQQDGEEGGLLDAVLVKIRHAQSDCIIKNENGLKRALVLNFLGITDPWISFREALDSPQPAEDGDREMSPANPWSSYYELFSSHLPGTVRTFPSEEEEKSRRALLREMVLYALPFISLLALFCVPPVYPGSIGAALFLWGFTFSLVLVMQYPRIRPSCGASLPAQMHASALRGQPVRLKGLLSRSDMCAFFPHLLFCQSEGRKIPAEVKALSPAESIFDDMRVEGEVEMTGWLRRNPHTYIEVKEIRKSSKMRIFCSQYILCKFILAWGSVFLGIFLMIMQQREVQ